MRPVMPGWLRRLLAPRQIGTHLACRACSEPWTPGARYCGMCGIVAAPRMVTDYRDPITRVQWFK